MSVIAAVNFVDKLVLLEDGRELEISQFYASLPDEPPLKADSQIRAEHRRDDWEGAEVFAVKLNKLGDALLFEVSAILLAKPSDIN